MTRFYFLFVLLLAVLFRFNNLNWDSNFHLHPDERFLTMVGNAMRIPANIGDYLNPQVSTLNPANVGFKFFVYGTLPLTLNKILTVVFNNDNYNAFTIQGRFMSALADLMVVALVYKSAQLIISKKTSNFKLQTSNIPLWSAFFYAIAVLPIQLSHFFAADTFLNLFMFASFYFALKSSRTLARDPHKIKITGVSHFVRNDNFKYMLLSAVFFGLALASKITAFFILPLNLFFLLSGLLVHHSTMRSNKDRIVLPRIFKILNFLLITTFYLLLSHLILRIANPYYFQSANFFDVRPSKLFIENLQSLKNLEKPDAWYPPGVQWIHKTPVIFSLYNLAVFGVGLPYFALIIMGIFGLMSRIKFQMSNKKMTINNYQLTIILLWVFVFFIYQSTQFAKTIRYFNIIYPFLAIFAAIGMQVVVSYWLLVIRKYKLNKKIFLSTFYLLLTTISLYWPFAFSSIYLTKNSRVAASEWIYQNIPNNSVILSEHWDDALPLPMERNYGKQFIVKELPVFAPDDKEKWRTMNQLLAQADYYILSSNRGWGSIPTVPERYPKMSKFYNDLFAGKLGYKKIRELVSYPKLEVACPVKFCKNFFGGNWKLEIPDDSAEETLTVYDHPKVIIFKKSNTY